MIAVSYTPVYNTRVSTVVHVIGHSYRLGDELALRAADGGDHAIRSRAVQLAPGAPPAPLLTFDRVDRG